MGVILLNIFGRNSDCAKRLGSRVTDRKKLINLVDIPEELPIQTTEEQNKENQEEEEEEEEEGGEEQEEEEEEEEEESDEESNE